MHEIIMNKINYKIGQTFFTEIKYNNEYRNYLYDCLIIKSQSDEAVILQL